MSEGRFSWPAFIDRLVAAVEKFFSAVVAFWAGRKSVEAKAEKEAGDEAKRQLELELEVGRRQRDPAERERVRERFRDRGDRG